LGKCPLYSKLECSLRYLPFFNTFGCVMNRYLVNVQLCNKCTSNNIKVRLVNCVLYKCEYKFNSNNERLSSGLFRRVYIINVICLFTIFWQTWEILGKHRLSVAKSSVGFIEAIRQWSWNCHSMLPSACSNFIFSNQYNIKSMIPEDHKGDKQEKSRYHNYKRTCTRWATILGSRTSTQY